MGKQQSLFATPGDDAEDADDRRVIVVGGPRAYRDPSTGMIVDPDHHGPGLVFGGGYRTITQAEAAADPRKLARSDDPETSHRAARKATDSGMVATHEARILDALRGARWPMTYREIGKAAGMEAVAVMRRLKRMSERGLIAMAGERACSLAGSKCQTWRAR